MTTPVTAHLTPADICAMAEAYHAQRSDEALIDAMLTAFALKNLREANDAEREAIRTLFRIMAGRF